WAAFRQSTPVNMWSFYNDRTCENTGWMDVPGEQSSETRVFVVAGRYEISADVITVIIEDVSGDSVLTSDYRPALNNSVLVFHDVIVDRDRLLYNNPNGMPVVYRREN
ncbi:MAG: hypothetical protein QGH20_03330, partial [Candidatus Latescibacteria bacterium]|nr:hypothetical protein [Candidatus Latescibacterota bacterium]